MSIIIKGESMPEACAFCPCFRDDSIDGVHGYMCKTTFVTYGKEDDWIWEKRPNWCPLVELHEKHGRLVEFIDVATRYDDDSGTEEINLGEVFGAYIKMREAPTVIEAEGG